MLEKWNERPQEIAHLLNPAFLGVLIRRAVARYETASSRGMPFALTPFILPLVLHARTRSMLPTIATTFPTWLQEHRELLVDFPHRVAELTPYTREALIFALQRNALTIDSQGGFREGKAKMKGKTKYPDKSVEIGECWRRSEFVGRWLAEAGPVATVYGLVGVSP
jgi:hypothetical protein